MKLTLSQARDMARHPRSDRWDEVKAALAKLVSHIDELNAKEAANAKS